MADALGIAPHQQRSFRFRVNSVTALRLAIVVSLLMTWEITANPGCYIAMWCLRCLRLDARY